MFQKQWFLPLYLTPVLFSKSMIRPKLSLFQHYRAQLLTEVLEYILQEAYGFADQGGIYLVIEFYLEIAH